MLFRLGELKMYIPYYGKETIYKAKGISNNTWYVGTYFIHEIIQPNPFDGIVDNSSNYQHCIIHDGFGDWGLSKPIEVTEIDPATLLKASHTYDTADNLIFEGDTVLFDNGTGKKKYLVFIQENTEIFKIKSIDNPNDIVELSTCKNIKVLDI